MRKYIFVLCAVFAVATSGITPRDIIDLIEAQLKQLKSIVQGEIMAADNSLEDLQTEFRTFGDNVHKNGDISLQQEHDSIIAQVGALKDLAQSVHVDISPCTNVREAFLNRLAGRYSNQMQDCIFTATIEANRMIKDSRYKIDTSFHKVTELEDDIKKCGNSIICMQPILNEIELYKVRIPGNIKNEVISVQGVVSTLRISVQGCATDKNAQYNTEAYSLLNDIQKCADRLLSY